MVRSPFRYYGSKWRLAPWIISYFPNHTAYVEAFGGMGAVLMQKQPSPIEVFNDLDQRVINFFRVLREQQEQLITQLRLTPYTRLECDVARVDEGSSLERVI